MLCSCPNLILMIGYLGASEEEIKVNIAAY